MSQDINIDELREKLAHNLAMMRDSVRADHPVRDGLTHQELPFVHSHHEAIQTYTLLLLLDKLQSIDDTLIRILNPLER